MDFINCPDCGKMFRYKNSLVCPACQKVEEEEFRLIRDYISENAGSDILQVSEATGVRVERIIRFLHDGRLSYYGNQRE